MRGLTFFYTNVTLEILILKCVCEFNWIFKEIYLSHRTTRLSLPIKFN